MYSLKEIAADIGVSAVLVSRVLSGRMGTTRVGKEMRETILRRAREVDYQPNPLAVNLRRRRKGVVGIFIHQIGIPGSELSLAFLAAASRTNLNFWVRFFALDSEFLAACKGLQNEMDALIIAGLAHQELAVPLKELEQLGLHVVCACEGVGSIYPGLTSVQLDRARQTYLTTQHLLEKGCRRIAHLHTFDDRARGFFQAHREAGLPWFEELVLKTDLFTREAGYLSTQALLQSGFPFDAINAQSDGQACGAMHCLTHAGVPRVSWPKITGIDDSPIATSYCDLPLTSATSEMDVCAEMAVAAVLAKLKGVAVQSAIVVPKLIVRTSTQ